MQLAVIDSHVCTHRRTATPTKPLGYVMAGLALEVRPDDLAGRVTIVDGRYESPENRLGLRSYLILVRELGRR